MRLTEQQQAVYSYIRQCIIDRGYGPTVREIGEHMDIKSPNGVICHLRALERKGVILRPAYKKRAIELTEPLTRDGQTRPIRARLGNGRITQNPEPHQTYSLDEVFGRSESFLVEVLDNHLQNVQIRRGDLITIDPGNSVASGSIVMVRRPTAGKWNNAQLASQHWLLGRCISIEKNIAVELFNSEKTLLKLNAEDVIGVAVGVIRKL